MTAPWHLKWLPVLLLSCLASCRTNPDPTGPGFVRSTREAAGKREDAWIKREGLVPASRDEIATAGAGEVPFVGNKASVPDLPLNVVFKKGVLQSVGGVGVHNLFTTSSAYELRNARTGKILLETASTIANGVLGQDNHKQKVIVSQDRTRLLIYETWGCGDGPHYTCALVTKVPDHDVWEVEYLKLPEFDGIDGIPDHGPTPVGFSGEELVFDALLNGTACKMKIRGIERIMNPLPFTVG